jgi:hypothetical protein
MNYSKICEVDFGSTCKCAYCGAWLDINWNTFIIREVTGLHFVKCPNCTNNILLEAKMTYNVFRECDMEEAVEEAKEKVYIVASIASPRMCPSNFRCFFFNDTDYLVVNKNSSWVKKPQYEIDINECTPKIMTYSEVMDFNKASDEVVFEVEVDDAANIKMIGQVKI